MKNTLFVGAVLVLSVFGSLVIARDAGAEEGMWLFNEPPVERVRLHLGVNLTDEWRERVQKSALRFNSGGSGAFVSATGLAVTNHHVVRSELVKVTTPERDVIGDGFLAPTPEEEVRLTDLSVQALWSIEDVTDEVKAAAEGQDVEAAERGRRAAIAAIESRSKDQTGMHSEVVTLYNGGLYHLYRYRRWEDVRLVYAPDDSIADFGGDVDNFRYPRYCLDVAIVRVYDDDGEPVSVEHFLPFAPEGVDASQPTFVAGHPGSTRRTLTTEHLSFLRDVVWPTQLRHITQREVELLTWSREESGNATSAYRDLPGFQNWRKAYVDRLAMLRDPRIFSVKALSENTFRTRVAADPERGPALREAYQQVGRSLEAYRDFHEEHFLLERLAMNRSELFRFARLLVRRADELEKPSGERLEAFTDARLPETERRLLSDAPVDLDLERHRLETGLSRLAGVYGADETMVREAFGGLSARDRAAQLVEASRLADRAVRERLMELSRSELAGADPMIRLARTLEGESRRLIERHEKEIEAVQTAAYDTIADARFAVFGTNDYPDATFSLRLSYGRVIGYEDQGRSVPPFTTFSGLIDRYTQRGPDAPFDLSQRWVEALEEIEPSTPFNFISTHHIIGGNSGSPVIDARARFVGVIFDGNEHSASWGSVYSMERGRAVSVDVRSIIAALKHARSKGSVLLDELAATP